MAFMQSVITSLDAVLAAKAVACMLARICIAAIAEVTGASVNARATIIARIARRRCSGRSFQIQGIMDGLILPSRYDFRSLPRAIRPL